MECKLPQPRKKTDLPCNNVVRSGVFVLFFIWEMKRLPSVSTWRTLSPHSMIPLGKKELKLKSLRPNA